MGLDYSKGCVNFRDVGDFVNYIANAKILRTKVLFRGGKIDFVEELIDIESPQTIVNLRKGVEKKAFGTKVLHFPISNDFEKYDTELKGVRNWLNLIISTFADGSVEYPVLIHCTSGKDRTGVVVAALLKIIGIDDEIIVQEYLLSEGQIDSEWIKRSLKGIGDPTAYFNRDQDLGFIKRNLKI